MCDIFISYTAEDRPWVERLARALEEQGWSVWWDRVIPAGEDFSEVIEERLEAASCVVVVWSRASVRSRWVRAEAQEGMDRHVLVPMTIDGARPPLGFRQLHTEDLGDWQGDLGAQAFQKLLADLRERLGPAPKPPTPSPTPESDDLPRFVEIPAAELHMGSASGREREAPEHTVRLERPFSLSAHPVTVRQFEAFVRAEDYRTQAERRPDAWPSWRQPGISQQEDHPVVKVSRYDAGAYCEWLGRTLGSTCRLPTEAEWELACRAGTRSRCFFGESSEDLDRYAWYADNARLGTWPVGRKDPNPYGLHDMLGNVWEWCHERYAEYPKRSEHVAGPEPEPGDRDYGVLRGGSWRDRPKNVSCTFRIRMRPGQQADNVGFRVVLPGAR